jgi:hypothetical protein
VTFCWQDGLRSPLNYVPPQSHSEGLCWCAAGEVDALDEADVGNILEAPDSEDELVSSSDSDADSDEDALRYEEMVDRYMDNAYQAYLERHHARDANRVERNKRKRLFSDGAPCRCSIFRAVVVYTHASFACELHCQGRTMRAQMRGHKGRTVTVVLEVCRGGGRGRRGFGGAAINARGIRVRV